MSLFGLVASLLAALGRRARARARFPLMFAAGSWGMLREAMRPTSWRRTVRYEFRLAMRQATGGGLATTIVTASLAGVAMVYEALYWAGIAGQAQLTGSLLVTVLVGLILLGLSGMLIATELGTWQAGGQIRTMQTQGIDPFLLLVLPRSLAFALSSFTARASLPAGNAPATGSVAPSTRRGPPPSLPKVLSPGRTGPGSRQALRHRPARPAIRPRT